jgi:hypothetical protein
MGAPSKEGEEERRWREVGAILQRRVPDFYAHLLVLAEVTIATLPSDSVPLHADMSESNIPG